MRNEVSGMYEGVVSKKVRLGFSLLMPESWESIPMIVYLHGAGENGINPKEYTGAVQDLCPFESPRFAILSPICPKDEIWEPDAVVSLIRDYVLKNYPVNPKRIYLTGYSMGGRGVWDCATEYPEVFAAVSALSGFSCYLRAEKMWNVPSWTFHGVKDSVVPIEESEKMVSALRMSFPDRNKCHTFHKFSRFFGAGHGTVGVYGAKEFYNWMLSHKKG